MRRCPKDMRTNDMITFEKANELFRYDGETGKLFLKKRVNPRIPATLEAGTLRAKDGYVNVGIGGKLYPAHMIAMLLTFGNIPKNSEVDHINHIRNDNRLCNLRFVSKSENRRNQSVSSRNSTGHTGTYFDRDRNKFVAQIKVNGKVIYLGSYGTLIEAVEARKAADKKYNFHPNHGTNESAYIRNR